MAADPQFVFIKAVVAKFNASSALDSINGPYWKEKPTGSGEIAFPYCIIDALPSFRFMDTDRARYWEHRFDFRVYHMVIEDAKTQAGLIETVFSADALSLTLDEGAFIALWLDNSGAAHDDKGVEHALLSYRGQSRQARF